MTVLDSIVNGKITKLEVRAGIPRRVVFEQRVSDLQGAAGMRNFDVPECLL